MAARHNRGIGHYRLFTLTATGCCVGVVLCCTALFSLKSVYAELLPEGVLIELIAFLIAVSAILVLFAYLLYFAFERNGAKW